MKAVIWCLWQLLLRFSGCHTRKQNYISFVNSCSEMILSEQLIRCYCVIKSVQTRSEHLFRQVVVQIAKQTCYCPCSWAKTGAKLEISIKIISKPIFFNEITFVKGTKTLIQIIFVASLCISIAKDKLPEFDSNYLEFSNTI